eukprot:scaffold1530_cov98-Cylindrotheca_fusiformis.AAC.3
MYCVGSYEEFSYTSKANITGVRRNPPVSFGMCATNDGSERLTHWRSPEHGHRIPARSLAIFLRVHLGSKQSREISRRFCTGVHVGYGERRNRSKNGSVHFTNRRNKRGLPTGIIVAESDEGSQQ